MRFNLIFFALFLITIWSSTAQSSWTIFRGNQQLSGTTSANLPEKPKLLCSFQTGDDIKTSPIVDDQTIYCGSTDGSMYAVGFDGKQKWKFVSGNAIEAPALFLDGSVVFGTLDGMFFKLNAKTGKQIWKYKSDNQIEGSANWLKVGKQIRLVVGSYDYNLHCVGFTKGDSIWRYESDNYINGAPAIYGKYAVFGGCDGYVHLVNIETGKVFKKIKLDTYVASSPVIDGKHAYVGDYEGRFFCIDLEAGKVEWSYW